MKKLIFLFALLVVWQVTLFASSNDTHHIELKKVNGNILEIKKSLKDQKSIDKNLSIIGDKVKNVELTLLKSLSTDDIKPKDKKDEGIISFNEIVIIVIFSVLLATALFFYRLYKNKNEERPKILIKIFGIEVVCTFIFIIFELVSIKEYEQLAIIFLGAPYAFFLWLWRNKDKREDLDKKKRANDNHENEVKAIKAANLQTDFHKLQEWAADDQKPEALRIAAINQLEAFISVKSEKVHRYAVLQLFKTLLESKANIEFSKWLTDEKSRYSQMLCLSYKIPIRINRYSFLQTASNHF